MIRLKLDEKESSRPKIRLLIGKHCWVQLSLTDLLHLRYQCDQIIQKLRPAK